MAGELQTENAAHDAHSVRIIRPVTGWHRIDFRELWQYRELAYFFAWRDLKVRYKQTLFGMSWAILQPFLSMVVFSIFFGRLAQVPSDGIPYPIFAYAALVPWYFCANGVRNAADSLVGANSASMLTKVYFPRMVLPLSSILSGLVDFGIAFVVLLGMMAFYGMTPTANIIWVPAFLLHAVICVVGVGLWLSAFNVRYRDVRHAVPFLVQLWLFATPVAYSSTLLPESWRVLYGINPMVGVVDGFRWALLGLDTQPGPMILVSAVTSMALFVSGMLYFRFMESSFADHV